MLYVVLSQHMQGSKNGVFTVPTKPATRSCYREDSEHINNKSSMKLCQHEECMDAIKGVMKIDAQDAITLEILDCVLTMLIQA